MMATSLRACDACGCSVVDYTLVRVANGGLVLCSSCLGQINEKNPQVPGLQKRIEELEAAVRAIANAPFDQHACGCFCCRRKQHIATQQRLRELVEGQS